MESIESTIKANVDQYGWHCASVSDWNPPFLYTIGLSKSYDHPEIILFGLSPQTGHSILTTVVQNIENGKRYDSPGRYQGVLENHDIGIKQVDESHHTKYMGFAMGFCREINIKDGLSAVQIYWPDSNGLLPYDPNCDIDTNACQPRLDIPLTDSEKSETDYFD